MVALQEVDSVTGRMNGRFIPEELGRMTGMHARFCRAIDYDGGGYGIGLLSRAEPLSVRRIPLPGREEARVLLMAEFPGYVVCVTHLSLTPEDQRASLPIIRQATDTCRKPVLLAGDFNMDDAGKVLGGLGRIQAAVGHRAAYVPLGPSFDTHRLHTGPRPAAVGENRRTHGGLHHRRFGPLPAVGVARLVDSGAGAPYTILHDRSSAPILPLRGTKPLSEAGGWGWVRIANDAEGGENDRRFSHAV